MNNDGLVSILTPSYNGGKYIHRLLDSVLNQTYKNIELIFVDDGSTDKTKEIVKSYIPKFSNIGMKLIYLYQNNAGQAAAINTALSIMSGEFMTWIDSDDFLKNTSVEKRVAKLEEAGRGHYCITQYELVHEDNVDKVISIGKRVKPEKDDTFFIDIIKNKNVVFAGSVMLKTADFLKICPDNKIFVIREGQNGQLMLPITYNYKCIYIDEPLYVVVEHKDSHSRIKRTLQQHIQREENFIVLLTETVKTMNITESEQINKLIFEAKYRECILIAEQYGDKPMQEKYLNLYKNKYGETEYNIFKKFVYGTIIDRIVRLLKRNRVIRKIFNKDQL